MKYTLKYIFLFCFCLSCRILESQNVQLILHASEKGLDFKDLNYKTKFFSKDAAYKEIAKVQQALQAKAYLLAMVDSIKEEDLSIHAYLTKGQAFEWANIRLGNLNQGLAAKIGFNEKIFQHKALYYKSLTIFIEKILRFYENSGYPFATVQLDSVMMEGNALSAALNVQKNKYFKIDSVLIKGSLKLNEGFIRQYYGLQSGMPYNEEVFGALSQKTRQLPFILEKQEQRVQLSNKTNKLILFYDKKDASQFDGIVGFLPDAATKKTILTGDVKLKLVNGVLKNGETFDLEWRRLKSQTQDFNGRITYPFMFKSPLGVDYNLKIYRRDSTFIDINSNVALQYYFRGLNYVKLFYKQRNGNLISTNGYEFISTLPDYADVLTQAYGLGVFYEQLDYRFNPKKGISLNVSGQAGNRHIKKNPKINPLAYEQVVLNSAQYQLEGHMAYYIQLIKNNVLKLALQGASVFGNNSIYKNELFRIGGLKTLRGFDEESIFTSSYLISTIEYRFLYSQNSNIFVFSDGAFYENLSNHKYNKDTPISVGAGISFETKAGILSISYALGNQMGNGFDARSGKIHFGLSALF